MYEQTLGYQGCWIPAAILVNEKLTDLDQKVYGVIHGFTSNGLECWASNRCIGSWLNRDEESISRSIGRLVEENLCERKIDKENGNRRTLSSRQPIAILTPADTLSSRQPIGQSPKNTRNYDKQGDCGQQTDYYNIVDNIKYNSIAATASPSLDEAIIEKDKAAVERILEEQLKKKKKAAKRKALVKMMATFSPKFEEAYASLTRRPDKIESYGRWEAAVELGVAEDILLKKWLLHLAEHGQYAQNFISWLDGRGWEGSKPSAGTSTTKPLAPAGATFKDWVSNTIDKMLQEAPTDIKEVFFSDVRKWREYVKNSSATAAQLMQKIRQEIDDKNI